MNLPRQAKHPIPQERSLLDLSAMAKTKRKSDLITEEEFNQMVARKGNQPPWRDSKGDSAADEMIEVRMGEDYRDSPLPRAEDVPVADRHSAVSAGAEEDLIAQLGENASGLSSPRPDPVEDLDQPTSTK